MYDDDDDDDDDDDNDECWISVEYLLFFPVAIFICWICCCWVYQSKCITISFHQHSSNLQIPETWSFGDYYQLPKHLLGRVTWLTKQKITK